MASLAQRPAAAPTLVRVAAPAPTPRLPASALVPPPVVKPLAPELYRLTATMTADTRALWDEARQLLGGDDAQVLERLLKAAVPELRRRTEGPVRHTTPRPTAEHSRHIPEAIRREVWRRDGGRCAFVGGDRRCEARRGLECHHVKAWMAGGPTTLENLELRCGAHNRHEARVFFAASRMHVPEHAGA